MNRITRKVLVGACALIVGLGTAPASATTAEITRSAWQMHIDPQPHGPLSNRGGGWGHGDQRYYVDARVPLVDAASWQAAPDGQIIGFDGRVFGYGGSNASRLGAFHCTWAVDYTYFQTLVTVPAGGTVTEFAVAFNGIDDGARISVYNAAYPAGLVVDGSYVYLGGSGTTNLASYMRVGVNRVVITQLDDCATGNNLREARVVVNGTVVPPAPADTTPPSVTAAVTPAAPDGDNGWYTGSPSVDFTTADSESAITSRTGCDSTTLSSDTTGRTLTCTATSAGGTGTASVTLKRDATPPSAAFTGAALDGSTIWTSQAAPGCTSEDAVSGVASCVVTGSTSVAGTRTLTATATDNAGNTSAVSRTYTVQDMTTTGFYQPVDLGGSLNLVKGGSTVPLKFNVLVDGVKQTSTSAVTGFSAAKVDCASGTATESVEFVTTGHTALRYDTSGAKFVQNWKTPTGAGDCYRATVTLADGDTISALFQLK